MNGQVAIAKAEPIGAAERRERFHERPGLVSPTPSQLRVVEAGERVHQRVGIRRDMQAEMLEIVADIGHDEQIFRRQDPAEAPARAWRPRCLRIEPPRDPGSSKQILVRGTNDAGRRRFRSGPAQPTDQDRRERLIRLTHQERGGGGDLVGETDDGELEPSAKQVGLPAQIDQRGQTSGADRDAGGSLAPGTTETVVYDHRDIDPGQRRQPAAQRLCTPIRILRQQQHALGAIRRPYVRLIHPGVRHDEAEPVFNDQHPTPSSYDTNRLR